MDVEFDDVGAVVKAASIEGSVFSRKSCAGGKIRAAVQVSPVKPSRL